MLLDWVSELVGPCQCCDCGPEVKPAYRQPLVRTVRTEGHKVELLVSPLAGMKGAVGYHTSVLIAGEEYYFSPNGIIATYEPFSHEGCEDMKRLYIGLSARSGCALLDSLSKYFQAGTYDLLTKNCNAFTDCALYFLCDQRLWSGFRTVEKLGAFAEANAQFVQTISRGVYVPNYWARDFVLEDVINDIESMREIQDDNEEMIDSSAIPLDEHVPGTGGVPSTGRTHWVEKDHRPEIIWVRRSSEKEDARGIVQRLPPSPVTHLKPFSTSYLSRNKL